MYSVCLFRTPLMAAAKKGSEEICEFLLKKGADPKFLDKNGKSVLVVHFNILQCLSNNV